MRVALVQQGKAHTWQWSYSLVHPRWQDDFNTLNCEHSAPM